LLECGFLALFGEFLFIAKALFGFFLDGLA
jgi:hypothetical protein